MDAAKDRLVEEIVLLALFLVSTAANSLALLVFCRRPGLRTVSNRFVINLLGVNLVTTCLLAPALFGEHSAAAGAARAAWAAAATAAASGGSLAALLAVLLIALDQHHAVTDPLRCHASLLQRRPGPLCAAAAAAAALFTAARAALAVCTLRTPCSRLLLALQLAYALVYLLAVLAPVAVVCVVYARIYAAARKSGLRARACGASALQLHDAPLPDVAEEEGLTLKIDANRAPAPPAPDAERHKFGPFLLPPERPQRCPSVASLRAARREGRSSEDLRRLPAVSSAPLLALHKPPSQASSRITSIRCRISNASLFRYREESRAARVGLLAGALALLHVPHAAWAAAAALGAAAEPARGPATALLLAAAAMSPFLFALRSRRVQREARRIFMPEKSAWERSGSAPAAAAAAMEGSRARAALELLRTLSPEAPAPRPPGNAAAPGACRGSFSSGGSTQLSSASDE